MKKTTLDKKRIGALALTTLMVFSFIATAFVSCNQPVIIEPIVDEHTELVEPIVQEKEEEKEENPEFVVDAQLIENILDGYYGNGQARLDKLAEEGFSEEEISIITAEVSRVYKERHPD